MRALRHDIKPRPRREFRYDNMDSVPLPHLKVKPEDMSSGNDMTAPPIKFGGYMSARGSQELPVTYADASRKFDFDKLKVPVINSP